ncbi:hypothetical protein EUV02_00795 [Polymorphobacter arshaanensis]|uniref:Glycerophosphoryl diester phosphodiesterase membrane domain-containing protein n=1 Tax=Glacieibacterium arshaanense TaxID=2511025 RepID=A0A4Y9EPQ7_9SPHN|nr:hypothetical protein [Polymorphobacter arshaanensis]TFU05607.1 hypothetical protein EUV02_00795 [Polymorphobacter arshaanensis]
MTFSVGSVWRATHAVVRRDWQIYAVVLAAFSVLPALVLRMTVQMPSLDHPEVRLGVAGWSFLIVNYVLALIGTLTVAALAGATAELRGQSVGTVLAGTVKPMMKLLAASLLALLIMTVAFTAIGFALGLLAGIVGILSGVKLPDTQSAGWVLFLILIFTAFIGVELYVVLRLSALPGIALFERIGIKASLRRTWRMTRGHMLTLLALALIYIVAAVPIVALVYLGTQKFGPPTGSLPAFVVAALLLLPGLVLSTYFSAAMGVVYRLLAGAEVEAA